MFNLSNITPRAVLFRFSVGSVHILRMADYLSGLSVATLHNITELIQSVYHARWFMERLNSDHQPGRLPVVKAEEKANVNRYPGQ